jgi:putative ATP-binding cassette transporter
MRALSIALALFAILVAIVGVVSHDPMTYVLAAASAGSAVTTLLSPKLSSFLRVFKVIFGVETLVFGSAYLVDDLGWWPKAYEDYTLPESLPIAVALFGILIFFIAKLPLVKRFMAIADRYFEENSLTRASIWPFGAFTVRQNSLAVAALVFLIVINQVEVAFDVRLSYFQNDFVNAMRNMDAHAFWFQLLAVFTPVVTLNAFAVVAEYVVTSTFLIRWRRFLTKSYVGSWMSDDAHYRMQLIGNQADNPDQRISEDIGKYTDGLYSYSVQALQNLTSIVSFAIILWTLSAGFAIPGTSIIVPGLLFWIALIYTALGTGLTHLIGRKLVPLNFEQQQREANFRFGLARSREYGEQIALLQGESREAASASANFDAVFDNYMSIVHVRKRLTAFTFAFRQASVVVPRIIGAPFFFAGKFNLGTFQQITSAFNNVNENMNFFVTFYVGLTEFKATFDRLESFDQSIQRAKGMSNLTPRVEMELGAEPNCELSEVNLALPDGRALVKVAHLTLKAGEPALVVGPSGTGKSTLFRAIAGLWPFGSGRIRKPEGELMMLPQRPYIPLGSLREAVAYPKPVDAYPEGAIEKAVQAVGLGQFVDQLDKKDLWQMRLSGGEQQRLAVARALLAEPAWLFLDEATASLDEKSEADLYQAITRELPKATLVSIGHRSTLEAFHDRRIEMTPHAGAAATVGE